VERRRPGLRRYRQPWPTDGVLLVVLELQREGQQRLALARQRRVQFKDGGVVLADGAIDGPAALLVAVDGGGDRQALLFKRRPRIDELECPGFAADGRRGDAEIGQREVAVVGASRPALGQAVVGQRLQANRGNPLQRDPRGEGVGVVVHV